MIRCGLIGYGAWGMHHARVMATNPKCHLVAIAAASGATCDQARSDHPTCVVATNYREILTRDDVDAVAVVLPSHLHFEVAHAVVESGRHLLLEKPMCLRVAHCQELLAAARDRQRVLAIGHEMRLSTLWGKAKELIAGGAVGDPMYLLIELWRCPYRLGAGGWRYDPTRVGSWILEEPIHFFDLARWYLEELAEPVSVYARANSWQADRPELHDHFSALVSFTGNRYAVISQSLGGWEHHQTVKVCGTEGALWAAWSGAMDRTLEPTYSLRLRRGSSVEEIAIPRAAGEVFELEAQFDRFLQAIETGVPPAATGEDGCWAVRLCLQAEESVRSGLPVPL
jgi:myo-inositol 2-dehydrogenase/D-chiro-inositol 1-dehydrogenase